ncbi:MAG: hypothetical protein ACREXQ_10850 [Polaromonas sp.]
MQRILASVVTLEQHVQALAHNREAYRPPACPHCQAGGLWRHGCYHRKADRRSGKSESLNPVAVLRFLCRACERTCSRLPACIAPRRWYDWAVQQVVLLLLLGGCSLHHCASCTCPDRRTVRRWRDWLQGRGESFAFFLRSRFPQLGRLADHASFWRNVINSLSLQQAMAWLDRDLLVP